MSFSYAGAARTLAAAWVLAVMATLSSCGSRQGVGPDDADVAPLPGLNAAIAFVDEGTLTLAPAELAVLAITTSPPGHYAVSFRLAGEALDASLEPTQVITDSDGRASVALRAPSQATVFALHATIVDGPSAQRTVSVSASGFGAIAVHPSYGGSRPIEDWVALAVPGTSCAALEALLPADPEGAITVSAPAGAKLVLTDAPVGPALAVVARAGHFAFGCVDAGPVVAGMTTDIDVPVGDRPVDALGTVLETTLNIQPDAEPWVAIAKAHTGLMTKALSGNGLGQPAALLTKMTSLASDPVGFAAISAAHGWPAQVAQHFTTSGLDLVEHVNTLATYALSGPPPAIRGTLAGPAEPDSGATFTLATFGPLLAADSGMPFVYPMSLSFDPNDVAHVGGELSLSPSRYIGAAISAKVLASEPPNTKLAEVLADYLQCDALVLEGYASCNASCIALLCDGAVAALWQDALDASSDNSLIATLPLQAAGAVSLDDAARLTEIDGTWLGKLSVGGLKAKLAGDFVATDPDKLAD
ncbi:MAG: hypothetical protein EXR75_03690 [Myxococcales bacterium]|nr:hypothetical protein [Myxococcales bacterium]